MDLPSEILLRVLELAFDNPVICCQVFSSEKTETAAWPDEEAWIPALRVVSKAFGSLTRDAIAKDVEINLAECERGMQMVRSYRGGAPLSQFTIKTRLVPDYFKERLPEVVVLQSKVYAGGFSDSVCVSGFASLRVLSFFVWDIEDLPRTKTEHWKLSLSSLDWYRKVNKTVVELANTDTLLPQQRREIIEHSHLQWNLWREATQQFKSPRMPKALDKALALRLKYGLASTKALLPGLAEQEHGITRSVVKGLQEETEARIYFHAKCTGEEERVSLRPTLGGAL